MVSLPLFYAQGCVRKLAATQHTPSAAGRERNLPYLIVGVHREGMAVWDKHARYYFRVKGG